MMDYSYLMTTTPWGERCAQVNADHYMENSRHEVKAYIAQLKRVLGENPTGSYFKMVRCEHDFGPYRDVRFYYDDEEQSHVDYLSQLEAGCEHWDEVALQELKAAGYDLREQNKVIQLPARPLMKIKKGA
ncbi:MAG: hypothetical protein KF763_15480 [Cyclobacteriaceae bacterium]|nr:hypothetical protein [Cyclobacteriaceae bacterium]